MRRMVTKSGIIDTVNEGIESGEIEVGGLPEFGEGEIGTVLSVYEDAETGDPAAGWMFPAAGGAGCVYWFSPNGNTHAFPIYLPIDTITSKADLATFLHDNGYTGYDHAYPFYAQDSASNQTPAPISMICGWNELYVYWGLFSSNGTTVSTRYFKITKTAFDSTTGVYTTTKSEAPTYGLSYCTIKKQQEVGL